MKHKSIGERLKRVKSSEVRQKILLDWAKNWEDDHHQTLDDLRGSIQRGDAHGIASDIASMRAIADKRFPALERILCKVDDNDAG